MRNSLTRLLFSLSLFSLSFSFVSAQDAAPETVSEFTDHPARVVTNINALNVRSTPAIAADNIVGRLQPGQQVHVLAREGAWQQVRSEDGLLGWSHSDYLIDLPPRQLGETRLFLLDDRLMDAPTVVHAELRHIGKHSYIYFAEHPGQSIGVNWNEVRAFAEVFDEHIYPDTIALWAPDPKPSHEGDERIVILFTVGYKNNTGALAGFHRHRDKMPDEPHPHDNRTGFIEITWHNGITPDFLYQLAAHELQHVTQHHFDADEACWVHEGFSVFNSAYLGYLEYQRPHAVSFLDISGEQINRSPPDGSCDYGNGFLFATYLLERLGLAALRDYVRQTENGLAALDALLAERDNGLDTETFYADFALANYLRDTQLADGHFGYQMLDSLDLPKPALEGRITELPILTQERLYQFATEYYEIALSESDQALDLELALQVAPDSLSTDGWDGWLQFVQVVDGEVSLQRFRASEYRNRMMSATLQPGVEQAFLAISLFRTRDKDIVAIAPYTLQVHLAGSDATTADYATIAPAETTNLADLTPLTEQKSPTHLAFAVKSVINEYARNFPRLSARGKTAELGQYYAKVAELLAAGADMENYGGDVLITVLKNSDTTVLLAMLLDAGADPDYKDSILTFSPGAAAHLRFPVSPLLYAVFFGDEESVALLLAAGANPNIGSFSGQALHLAALDGNTRIIELLLAAGADPNLKAVGGQTAADFARQYGHHAVAQMLEAAAAN